LELPEGVGIGDDLRPNLLQLGTGLVVGAILARADQDPFDLQRGFHLVPLEVLVVVAPRVLVREFQFVGSGIDMPAQQQLDHGSPDFRVPIEALRPRRSQQELLAHELVEDVPFDLRG
jgi:hypothetical protein